MTSEKFLPKLPSDIPDGYYALTPEDVSIPGEDIYRNSRGTWTKSMNAGRVGIWTTFARKIKEEPPKRVAKPRDVPARVAKLRS